MISSETFTVDENHMTSFSRKVILCLLTFIIYPYSFKTVILIWFSTSDLTTSNLGIEKSWLDLKYPMHLFYLVPSTSSQWKTQWVSVFSTRTNLFHMIIKWPQGLLSFLTESFTLALKPLKRCSWNTFLACLILVCTSCQEVKSNLNFLNIPKRSKFIWQKHFQDQKKKKPLLKRKIHNFPQ